MVYFFFFYRLEDKIGILILVSDVYIKSVLHEGYWKYVAVFKWFMNILKCINYFLFSITYADNLSLDSSYITDYFVTIPALYNHLTIYVLGSVYGVRSILQFPARKTERDTGRETPADTAVATHGRAAASGANTHLKNSPHLSYLAVIWPVLASLRRHYTQSAQYRRSWL